MNVISKYLPILLCGVMGGCTAPPAEKKSDAAEVIDKQIVEASRKIERMQLQLVQAGALRRTPDTIPAIALSEGQVITLSWQGDAYQLLARLATERGMEFDVIGVRLPLPVAIKIQDQPFDAALDVIRAQTSYRASVIRSASKITLQFRRPQEGKS